MFEKILIYDSYSFGHHIEFIEYILDFLENNPASTSSILFLLNKNTIKELTHKIPAFNEIITNVSFIPIEITWQSKFDNSTNTFKRALLEKKYLQEKLAQHQINKIIFLQLDIFQFIIGAWRFSNFNVLKISGILFEPYVQEPLSDLKIFFKKVRKRLQLQWMFLNKNIHQIFILNDENSVHKLNSLNGFTSKFSYLPDPIKLRPYQKVGIREKYNISDSKKILLFIGGVQRRKNLSIILDAISKLSTAHRKDICFLILGKCDDKVLYEEINDKIKIISSCQIIFDDRRLSNDELESAIAVADLGFVVYSKFYCSSGVLGNLAKHNKFLIASKVGVIGHLTLKYKLGNAVNPNEVLEIKTGIEDFLNKGNDFFDLNNDVFVEEHSYLKFAKQLIA